MTSNEFVKRHIGPRDHELPEMLNIIGVDSLDQLIEKTVPENLRIKKPLNLPPAMSEVEYLNYIKILGTKNKQMRSFIGQGYYGVAPLSVIIRNVLENPSWYTSYTPYQAEISQGRLEALLNFQTMIIELTGMEIANASLLDESTAAAEAMIMMYNARSKAAVKNGANKFFVDEDTFLQTLDVIKTRSVPLGIELVTGKYNTFEFNESVFGSFIQYPAASGNINDYRSFVDQAHASGILVGVGADLMSLAILTPPGEWGADIVIGSNQRMGLPMSYGGPHAGYFATREELKRSMPGRIIGVSVDSQSNNALRMALQTREQHIKREGPHQIYVLPRLSWPPCRECTRSTMVLRALRRLQIIFTKRHVHLLMLLKRWDSNRRTGNSLIPLESYYHRIYLQKSFKRKLFLPD